jgi:hypothetical protein
MLLLYVHAVNFFQHNTNQNGREVLANDIILCPFSPFVIDPIALPSEFKYAATYWYCSP